MEKPETLLKEWALNFLKNKDIIAKNIVSIDEKPGSGEFTVKFRQKDVRYLVRRELTAELLESLENSQHIGIFTYHTRNNFRILLEKWNELSILKNLTLYFVNPFLLAENKWIIQPYVHSRIADSVSLKAGLETMFLAVAPVSEKDLKSGFDYSA